MQPHPLYPNPDFSHVKKNPSFIVLEGIDGSGKTTLQKEIAKFFTEREKLFLCTNEPGFTNLGKQVRELLKKGGLDPKVGYLLVEAARLELIQKLNMALLDNPNLIIIGDRHSDSSWAYQGALGVEDSLIEILQKKYQSLLVPDITIYLDIHPNTAFFRRYERTTLDTDFFDSQKEEFFEAVIQRYYQRISQNRNKYFIVDANQSIEKVTSIVITFLKELFPC